MFGWVRVVEMLQEDNFIKCLFKIVIFCLQYYTCFVNALHIQYIASYPYFQTMIFMAGVLRDEH